MVYRLVPFHVDRKSIRRECEKLKFRNTVNFNRDAKAAVCDINHRASGKVAVTHIEENKNGEKAEKER